MVRRRQIEKRTDRLHRLDGDKAKSAAAQCNIRMHSCYRGASCQVFGVRRFGTRDSTLWSQRRYQCAKSGGLQARTALPVTLHIRFRRIRRRGSGIKSVASETLAFL
jgi:hypothetical protein